METGQELTSERDVYALGEKIGEGGFGVTWRAERASDGEQVVIKQLRLERLDDWKSMELFEREASVLRGLEHPHIVGYVDDFALEQDGAMVLVQRFVAGETLLDWMKSSRPIEANMMASWFHQILDVCAYLHSLSPPVIHRDISPKNIILDEDGHATLIDFGTVQAAIRSASSVSSTSAGTFGYASMEQMIGRAIPQSDLYGLGMTFIAVATGRHPEDLPFKGSRVDVREALEGTAVDARLRIVLEEMTHPDADSRPESARKVLERLQPLWDALDSAPPARPPKKPAPEVVAAEKDTEEPDRAVESEAAPALEADFTPEVVDEAEIEKITREQITPWLEAKERVERLTGENALGAPPSLGKNLEFERIAIDPRGRWLVLCSYYAVYAFRLETGEAQRLYFDSRSGKFCLFSPDGSLLLVGEGYEGIIRAFDVTNEALEDRDTLHIEGDFGGYSAMAISPDNKLVALSGSWDNGIYELETTTKIQDIPEGNDAEWLGFSPDGGALLMVNEDEDLVRLSSGEETPAIEDGVIAYSKDGRVCVLADTLDYEIRVRIFHTETNDPFRKDARATLTLDLAQSDFSPYKIRGIQLIEQDRTCAIIADADDPHRRCIALFDVETGTYKGRLGNEFHPGGDFNDGPNFYVAFSDVGSLAFVSSWDRASVLTDEDDTVINVLSLEHKRQLGFIRGLDISTKIDTASGQGLINALSVGDPDLYKEGVENVVPYYMTTEGFFWFPNREEPLTQSEYEDRALTIGRLFREELAPKDAGELARDQILDIRARMLMGEEQLVMEGSSQAMSRYLAATRGITHLIPAIVREALDRAEQAPTFGNTSSGKTNLMNQMAIVAEEFGERPSDEREVLFEQMQEDLASFVRQEFEAAVAKRNEAARAEFEREREREEAARKEAARKAAEAKAAKLEQRAREEAEKKAREIKEMQRTKRDEEIVAYNENVRALQLEKSRKKKITLAVGLGLTFITMAALLWFFMSI